ncbi:MAG TPA: DNA primase [Bacilli bacterium]|nr:DNA primase [Bacilli bacterium]
MNQISQELINEIRSSIDIVDVIGNYIELQPRGKNYFCVCPFHNDNHPSMSISKDKQIYTCFSCHATGNVFKFLMDYENISFIEAVKKCADLANISIDINLNNTNSAKLEKFSDLYNIYDTSAKFYQNLINTANGKEAKEYLYKRDINDELIKEFKIGLSLTDRELLSKYLIKKEFNKSDLLKSGLILENNYGISDIYCNRIMFPLEDLQGRVVGFSGRIYNTNDNSKYINTKETEIFKKRNLLYNYARAKDEAKKNGFVIVMEGFMDVIRAYSVGIKNVVATMGTAVTSNHAMTLKKMAKEIYLCFDGDQAGAKATMACITELEHVGVIPKVIRLEENLDPDEYIKKYGVDRFNEKIENPISIMDFKMSYLKKEKDIGKIEDKASYVNEVINELKKIDDDVLREITLKKLSYESELDINFLREKVNENIVKKEEVVISDNDNLKKSKISGCEKATIKLIYYMLISKEVIRIYDKKVLHIPNDRYRILAREISEYYHKYNDIILADFISYLNDYKEVLDTLNEILSYEINDDYTLEDIDGYINTIKNNVIKSQKERIENKLKEADSLEEQNKLLAQLVDLAKQK